MYLRNNLLTSPVQDLDPLNDHQPGLFTGYSPIAAIDLRAAFVCYALPA